MTTTTIETVGGPMVIDEEELRVGRFLDAEGNIPTHDAIVAFMKRHVKPGDSVIDVGANAGFFTLVLADIVGPTGHVTAYEPNYEVLKNLGSSITDRDLTHVDAILMAIGKEKGWGDVRFDPRGPGGTQVIPARPIPELGFEGSVFIRTLDSAPYIRRPVSFIKIDTEGMDVDVLLGAQTILQDDRPVILFEFNPEKMKDLGKDPLAEVTRLNAVCDGLGYIACQYQRDVPMSIPCDRHGDYALIPDEEVKA